MKKNGIAAETRAEEAVIDRPVGPVPLLWLTILGILFYLASIFVALAVEPATPSINGRAISAASTSSSSKPRQSWFHRVFHKPTWSEVLEQCESPRDVCNVVSRFVGYRTEEIDRWASADETWQRGRGDCEDFAICIEALCRELGFSATVNLYFPSGLRGDGHAVAVGIWNGRMWMSSNGSYREVGSIDEVKETVAQMYGCSGDELWGTVLAHADIERRLHSSSGWSVSAAVGP
jgi:predicted transglutaminase-like cysteine proteinase